MAEEGFPSPPMPKRPPGFNLYCDVCQTVIKRVVPYCERDDENLDFLPDFCTFNYNKVLRTECDYLVDVMEYAWCPNACSEIRRLKSFSGPKICHHPLVNCTERAYTPSPSPSPSPSSSMALPYDCVLCEFVLKHMAVMCMNDEAVTKRAMYQVCMSKTKTKEDFDHCSSFLNELVALAGTEDPCSMLTCKNPRAACRMNAETAQCHVAEYDGEQAPQYTDLGMDKDGNLFDPANISTFGHLQGLGPGDFKPGIKPYHSLLPIRQHALPPHIRLPGHLVQDKEPSVPVTPEAIENAAKEQKASVEQSNQAISSQPTPAPIPLQDVSLQL
eukprot:c1121_g1_i1.p1 GENE.c1121_g1_i1~~c1121_g1_i1.p1  ORF type:complete len:360 (-),score=72.87 c1121_g1_i1:95-1081(-)